MNIWETKKQYQALKVGDQWTIGDVREDSVIINDGIYAYYKWETKEAAEKAAEAYNEYEGSEWLGQHGVIFESELDDYDEEMIELYRLFGAIKNKFNELGSTVHGEIMMFEKNEIFYPNKTYFKLDFDKIKTNLKQVSNDYIDYGSVMLIRSDTHWMSINELGKVQVFYNSISPTELSTSLLKIEKVFKNYIEDFNIMH